MTALVLVENQVRQKKDKIKTERFGNDDLMRFVSTLIVLIIMVGCNVEGEVESELTINEGPVSEEIGSDLTALITYSVNEGELGTPTLHPVPDDLETDRDDRELHAYVWSHARKVFKSQLSRITRYIIFSDGVDGTLALVQPRVGGVSEWVLAIDLDDALTETGDINLDDFTYTLVHELGHVITLNSEQIRPNRAVSADPTDQDAFEAAQAECPHLFLQEGCTLEGAYLHAFYEQFWTDLWSEFGVIDALEDEIEREEAKEDFFANYADRFLTKYAATNITEDFAESWTHFALGPTPTNTTERDQKIRFFENYPALVNIANDIRNAGLADEVVLHRD